MRKIAALYVQKDGSYYGLDGIDPWWRNRQFSEDWHARALSGSAHNYGENRPTY